MILSFSFPLMVFAIDPKRIKQLEGKWAPHLCSTEAGEEQDITQLFQDCIDKQNDKIPPPTSLQDLPTLLGVEDSLRQAKTGKAGGPDKIASDWMHYGAKAISLPTWQLATKTRLWATEAFQHKGGSLAWIFKKGSWLLPENYRAIALTSTLGKRIHAPLRKEIMEVLATEGTIGQLGGFPGQETLFGTHYLRSFQRTRLMKNDNTAILFIDLRMAFHGLIREAVHGGDNTRAEEQATLWGHLRKEEIPLQTLLREIDQGGCLRQMGANESLIQTLQELSNSTWYEVEGRAVVTMKGSRPGSPLADALFHSQMQRISHRLKEMLKDLTELQEEDGNQKVGAGEPIYWADDLAIPLHATTCSHIDQLVEEVTERVNDIFLKYGLKMNFSQGKSGVILTYRGAGSAEARKELLRKREDTFNIQEENKTHKLYKGMTYKHLGVYQESGGQINYEIKCRVGATWQSFRTLRRSVLCTRRLKLATRLQMCNTLVFTKLFFASGTLPVLTRKQWKKIDTCYMTILRTITGELYRKDGSRKYKNDEDFLVAYGLTSSRIRITQERLTYARRLSLQAHDLLHEILQQEKESRPDSWHQALEADLRWLQGTAGGNWGLNYQQASEAWRVRKGWSNHIKKATLKHNRQEKIAREIMKWNHNAQQDQRPEAEFECECGQTFKTKGGLATHKARIHNYRTPEYWLMNSTRCWVCNTEFWTRARAQQHLAYISRTAKPNRCYTILDKLNPTIDLEDKMEPAEKLCWEGIRRRESVKLPGPLIFGATKADADWANAELESTRSRLESNTDFREANHLHGKVMEELEASFTQDRENWPVNQLEGLRRNGLENAQGTWHLLEWGNTKTFNEEDKQEWAQLINDLEDGPDLQEFATLKNQANLCRQLADEDPHRQVYRGPANNKERHDRDVEVPRTLESLRERTDWPLRTAEGHLRKVDLEKLLDPVRPLRALWLA